ncbi:MAG: hypothetical protein K0R54_236 [Clostridiaceae bacterium]|jgi:hypothetical protein|nr:hypothetical protein [Clostridiaceae bacterium]
MTTQLKNNIKQATITISQKEATEIQDILNIAEGRYEESNDILKTYTVKFDNGFFADIKICNGDTPYVDSLLFDKNGNQVCVLEISEEILGEYLFEHNGIEYMVIMSIGE